MIDKSGPGKIHEVILVSPRLPKWLESVKVSISFPVVRTDD